MSTDVSLESKIAAIRPADAPAPARRSRKFAFRPTAGASENDGVNGCVLFAFADPRDELAATTAADRRKRSVRKHLNKQSRLNGRRALRAAREVQPVKADTHCARELALVGRHDRAGVEAFPAKGTPERDRFEQTHRESFRDTERRAIAHREAAAAQPARRLGAFARPLLSI